MPIPNNLAEWIERAKKEATDPSLMPPPTDPATPPLKMPEVVDIKDLPEAKRQELEQVIKQAELQQQQMAREAATMPQQPAEGVAEAIRAAEGGARKIEIDDDVSGKPPQPPQKPIPDLSKPLKQQLKEKQEYQQAQEAYAEAMAQPQPQPKPEPKPEPTAETAPERRQCPNCSWDLRSDDVIEITDQDRQNFLAATLGGKPFQKLFEMMGGQLQVTLRSLQYNEVDACYRQCYDDRTNNQISNANDFIEQLNRYRLCLQLVEVRSGEDLITFPESLTAWGGTGDYQSLPGILDQVFNDALRSETMMRMVTKCMAKFNRIIARLEANCDNENFWKATGPTS